ncbi:hypothetical protein V6N12_028679 [Hibiscus sabdariffa]|uniref:Uncharacterized protein n=1 Tax=Hibiscus sabdariffa TaxID=183260 RepID=A0ABR2F6J2_9ROSI
MLSKGSSDDEESQSDKEEAISVRLNTQGCVSNGYEGVVVECVGVGNTDEEEGCLKVIAITLILDAPYSRNEIEEGGRVMGFASLLCGLLYKLGLALGCLSHTSGLILWIFFLLLLLVLRVVRFLSTVKHGTWHCGGLFSKMVLSACNAEAYCLVLGVLQ